MKRLMLFSAGLLLVLSAAGCCYRPAYVDPCTGIPCGGYWDAGSCPLMNLLCSPGCAVAGGGCAVGYDPCLPQCDSVCPTYPAVVGDPCQPCEPSYHVPGGSQFAPQYGPVVPGYPSVTPQYAPQPAPQYAPQYGPQYAPAAPGQSTPPPAPPSSDPPGEQSSTYSVPSHQLPGTGPAMIQEAANVQWVPAR